MTEILIRQRFNQAIHEDVNFAAVRLPGSNTVYYFYSAAQPLLQQVKTGNPDAVQFICSPYGAGNLGYVMQADTAYADDKLIRGEALKPVPDDHTFAFPFTHDPHNFFADQPFYEAYVEQGINAIKKDRLDKVVAARSESVKLKPGFDVAAFYSKLTQQYPLACVYFFYIKDIGCWCGATPEKLLTVEKNELQTVALAGTLPADSPDEWTDKEHDEQNMTEFFIDETFKSLKLERYKKSPVETIEAGPIKHLRSTFSWKPKAEDLHQKFGKILGALNPTPAVCGLPQFEASIFISKNEKLERRFYSGFVGLIHKNEAQLFVNLRCMEIGKDAALLYAGAGITEDSNPAAEWEETATKMNTLRALL
jgi:isochorismate synthase EntC